MGKKKKTSKNNKTSPSLLFATDDYVCWREVNFIELWMKVTDVMLYVQETAFLNMVSFDMTPDCLFDLYYHREDDVYEIYHFEYTAQRDDTEYILLITADFRNGTEISKKECHNQIITEWSPKLLALEGLDYKKVNTGSIRQLVPEWDTRLLAVTDGEVVSYFPIDEEWEADPQLQIIQNIINKDDMYTDYFSAYARFCLMSMYLINPTVIGEHSHKNENLIVLCDQLKGLAKYYFIDSDSDMPDDYDLDIFPLLVKSGINIYTNSCVFYSEGTFHGCQFMPDENDLKLRQESKSCFDSSPEDFKFESGLFEEVFVEKIPEKVIDILNFWWNNQSDDEYMYKIPLSAEAYVRTRNPYQELEDVQIKGGSRELFAEEKKQLKKLKKHFMQ